MDFTFGRLSYFVIKDSNGNMTADLDRGIVAIRYNLLNLPDTVQFENGNRIVYFYYAGGERAGAVTTTYSTPISVPLDSVYLGEDPHFDMWEHRHGNLFYKMGSPSRLLFDNGFFELAERHGGLISQIPYVFVRDHLGSVRLVCNGNTGEVVQSLEYLPSGVIFRSRNFDRQPYRFTGKELLSAHGLDWYDSGARMQEFHIPRFTTMDPLCEKYYPISPYAYCNNNPVKYIDPDGRDVYMLFYTTDYKMFKASAETRKREIEGMRGFNSEKDKVIMFGVSDLSEIGDLANWAIDIFSEQYGQTAEAGVWSHAGWDGPIGATPTSGDYALHDYQMSLEGWNSINFNWNSEGANMSFYGCNTGNDIAGGQWVGSFARNISEQSNFKGVNVWGQQTSSYPSFSPYIRATNFARTAGYGYGIGDTYMVGGNAGEGKQSHWFMRGNYPRANPMNIYKNGRLVRSTFQNR